MEEEKGKPKRLTIRNYCPLQEKEMWFSYCIGCKYYKEIKKGNRTKWYCYWWTEHLLKFA
jgi:hypothetical protein